MNRTVLKALITVLFLLPASLCGASPFCDFIDRVQETYCPTATTSLPVPEFCGETTRDEIDDLITSTHETFWDYDYRLISIENLKGFLDVTSIKDIPTGDYNWHNCDDYAKRLLGKVMEWAPGIAFGIAWIVNEEGTYSHAVNVMIDCNLDVWRIEPQGNIVTLWDENSHVILLNDNSEAH